MALLRNALTHLYGNQTSAFFELDPPSLQDYLRLIKKIQEMANTKGKYMIAILLIVKLTETGKL